MSPRDLGPCCWPLCDERATEEVFNVGYCAAHARARREEIEEEA